MTLKSNDTPTRACGSGLVIANLPVATQSARPLLITPGGKSVNRVSATLSMESVSAEPMGAKRWVPLIWLPSGGQLPSGTLGGMVPLPGPSGRTSGFGATYASPRPKL